MMPATDSFVTPLAAGFRNLPVGANVAIAGVSGAAIWFAGTSLARTVDGIAERTGIGRAMAGAVLLGVATSLPEIATTVTAGLVGNPRLATSNLIGGVVHQTAILAFVDWAVVRGALTGIAAKPTLVLSGVLLMTQLSALIAFSVGGAAVSPRLLAWGPACLFAFYLLALRAIRAYEDDPSWRPTGGAVDQPGRDDAANDETSDAARDGGRTTTWRGARLYASFAGAAGGVLVAGWALSRAGDALATQTGLGSTRVGGLLLAVSTSLPEISTTVSAVRLGAHAMAVSAVIGTNLLEVGLLFVGDLAYRQGSVLTDFGAPETFLAAVAAVLTGVYLWGCLEQRDTTFLGMGVESAAVIAIYAASILLFYYMG